MRRVSSNRNRRPSLILASASPRRAELLRDAGYPVRVVVPPYDEPVDPRGDESPIDFARRLALEKAESVRSVVEQGIILGGDTIGVLSGRIFGKPVDRDDARRIITSLAGTTHEVITALALVDAASGRSLADHDVTHVTMKRLTDGEVEAYLDSGAWRGKAGAYGIQDEGDRFVSRIAGSFSNVVGLPLELLERMLQRFSGSHLL